MCHLFTIIKTVKPSFSKLLIDKLVIIARNWEELYSYEISEPTGFGSLVLFTCNNKGFLEICFKQIMKWNLIDINQYRNLQIQNMN